MNERAAMRFRNTRFYKNGQWVRPHHFPPLRTLQLWLGDYAPLGPSWGRDDRCWVDVIEGPLNWLACAIHGHEWIVTDYGKPTCRWCNARAV
jgi:hypothetical protein